MKTIPGKLCKFLLLFAIRFYRIVLSPVLPPACRFLPSCSEYAAEALQLHGVAKGTVLTVKRLARCHPWGGSGYDPVPQSTKSCC